MWSENSLPVEFRAVPGSQLETSTVPFMPGWMVQT